ncbi:MAG: AmmeMemoRadiSam system protein B [Dehalococcoidia bacterium]|nr:AmmeMemoRadiSam system protein B [Dehalococcoidia bacterium]
MANESTSPISGRPKLRPLDMRWVQDGDAKWLMLRDPLGISPQPLLVPGGAAPLLALCDGTRDLATIRSSAELRAGLRLTPAQLAEFVSALDQALLLDNERFHQAHAKALRTYRSAPFRSPALAGTAYPAEPEQLAQTLVGYSKNLAPRQASSAEHGDDRRVMGVLSPHIDYARGGPVYAATWAHLQDELQQTELVVVLGTDHVGGPGELTLTRKSYATPLGRAPTDTQLVDALTDALGPDTVFANELHHRNEHSVELATVWLHHLLRGRAVALLPVLCGSMHHLVRNGGDPGDDQAFTSFLTLLAETMRQRRTLIVAAGDLAHVGPVFGDAAPYGRPARDRLASADRESLAAIGRVDPEGFFSTVRRDRDARRYCGLTPIYLMLRLLETAGASQGDLIAYDQCPADDEGGSFVSIAGMVFKGGAS